MMSALLNAILLNALVATALAVAVWVAGEIPAIRRRPGLRQGLWIVVLLKLVTPPLFELPILPGWLVANPAPMLHPKSIPLDNLSVKSSVVADELRPERPQLAEPNTATGIDWLWIAAFVNGFGTLTVLTLATGQIWRLRRALRRGATNDERLSGIGGLMADRMGLRVVPTMCVVAANVSPLLWVRRSGPLIVLPRRLVAQFTDEQLGCVLSHEIAHYLRRDHWTNLLSLMVAAVCWWNPIVWWARRELRMAQEACCDALVISRATTSRRKYAETLLQALEFIQAERSRLPALASGFGGKSSTERRFEMIANARVSHHLSWRNYALLIAALAMLPCSLAVTEAQDVASDNEIGVAATGLVGDDEQVPEKDSSKRKLKESVKKKIETPRQEFDRKLQESLKEKILKEFDNKFKRSSQNGKDTPQPDAHVEDKIQQLPAQRQNAESRVAAYERAFQRQLNLNDKVRQLQSRLKQQYPDGRSAEFQQEFLRGLKAINRELEEQPEVESRVAEYEREFQRQLNAQRASREATSLNDKVRQLQSRLKQQYPDGRSAEFQQEFLRGLKAINRELEEQPEVESRVAEYEREFQRQLNAQGHKDK